MLPCTHWGHWFLDTMVLLYDYVVTPLSQYVISYHSITILLALHHLVTSVLTQCNRHPFSAILSVILYDGWNASIHCSLLHGGLCVACHAPGWLSVCVSLPHTCVTAIHMYYCHTHVLLPYTCVTHAEFLASRCMGSCGPSRFWTLLFEKPYMYSRHFFIILGAKASKSSPMQVECRRNVWMDSRMSSKTIWARLMASLLLGQACLTTRIHD